MDQKQRSFNLLKESVCRKFGKQITSSSDCLLLAQKFEEKGIIINAQTFRRFFGLVKSSGGFSQFTLDSLSKYCGFPDYISFQNEALNNEFEILLGDTVSKKSAKEYWDISEIICQRISASSFHLSNIHHQLIQFPIARTYFMEHHPMRDLVGTVYTQYFQEYLKYETSNEAKLFAYGFLYIGAFLTENRSFMDIYFEKILETKLTGQIYLLPAGRKFGVQLLHYWLLNDNSGFDHTFDQMLNARILYKEASEKSVCSFEHSVLEHLIFTTKTEEMRFLVDNNTSQLFDDQEFVREDRKENHQECWKILCAVAHFKSGEFEISKKYINDVSLEKLSVGWRKYYAIIYYFVKYEFADLFEKSEIKNNLETLIEETHFTYYHKLFSKL